MATNRTIEASIKAVIEISAFKDKGIEWKFIKELLTREDARLGDMFGLCGYFLQRAGYIRRYDIKNKEILPGDKRNVHMVYITDKFWEKTNDANAIREVLRQVVREKSRENSHLKRIENSINWKLTSTDRKDQFKRPLYSLTEAASLLGISHGTLTHYISTKNLPVARSVDQTVSVRTANPRLFYHKGQIVKMKQAIVESDRKFPQMVVDPTLIAHTSNPEYAKLNPERAESLRDTSVKIDLSEVQAANKRINRSEAAKRSWESRRQKEQKSESFSDVNQMLDSLKKPFQQRKEITLLKEGESTIFPLNVGGKILNCLVIVNPSKIDKIMAISPGETIENETTIIVATK